MKTMKTTKKLAAMLLAMLAFTTTGYAQQAYVPSPASADQVPSADPASGNTMTKEYVQAVGQMAYIWGWPLVNMSNRATAFSKVKEPSVYGGLPMGYNGLAMLTDYISPEQKSVACPNQDVVYGTGFFDLDTGSVVLQVHDFKDRFWVYAAYVPAPRSSRKLASPTAPGPAFI
jgi:hypothetical protein